MNAMSSITITLPDDRLQKLKEKAVQLRVSPEELVRASVEEMLERPEEDFRRALDYVLHKNAELYRRLA
jgi:antitoxin FitA